MASLTRELFLFYEMRSTAKLMYEELSDEAIVTEIVEQNLFQYPTEKSITRMAKACIKRLHALEDETLVSAIALQPTETAMKICNLYKTLLSICDDMDITDVIPNMEEADGSLYLLEQLNSAIGNGEFIDKIQYEPHEPSDVLILTDVDGLAYAGGEWVASTGY